MPQGRLLRKAQGLTVTVNENRLWFLIDIVERTRIEQNSLNHTEFD